MKDELGRKLKSEFATLRPKKHIADSGDENKQKVQKMYHGKKT